MRAEKGLVYFYKKGDANDSILGKDNATFYLLCKESQKRNILIQIDNARLLTSVNDSLVFVDYLPGLKYEAWYMKSEDSLITTGNINKGKLTLASFLNGLSQMDRNKIRIQIFLREENELILENQYYFRN